MAVGLKRYGLGARLYDLISGERLVYRAGRVTAIEDLQLQKGERVLDVGCGTGLNFPQLLDSIGSTGSLVGVDLSQSMLDVAARKVRAHQWRNVELMRSDASKLATRLGATEPFDAVLFTYSLSIFDEWEQAWEAAYGLLKVGGRFGIVDMALPGGWGRLLSPIARFACFTGGADSKRHPWRLAEMAGDDVRHSELRNGHIHIVTGRKKL